jgi:hypothetical protein
MGIVVTCKGIIAGCEIYTPVFSRIQYPCTLVFAMPFAKNREDQQIRLFGNLQFILTAEKMVE